MINIIVGLGNPGDKYAGTRHNVGAAFIVAVAESFNIKIKPNKKYFGQLGKGRIGDHELSLLIPDTFMNESGKSVSAFLNFYKIDPSSMLVVHDDLDLPVGTARYKDGGGHGGHNGLRDIIACLGNENSFKRLRIGIDHPGDASQVTNYVLKAPLTNQKELIKKSFQNAMKSLPMLFDDNWDAALLDLHTKNKAL